MNILVLIKEVPDMEKVKFDSEKGVVNRSSAESEINPFDMNALQSAIDIKNKYGADITVLTMGPLRAEKSLRDAYARGADNVVLMTDCRFSGADTCATSRTLSAGIKYLGTFDLIICGEKSVDGDTAQVGAEVAEFLDMPHAYYVENINSIDKTEIEVVIENICGSKQVRRMKLPALIGVTKNINLPKLPTVNRKLKSLEIDVEKISLDDLYEHIDADETGFKGSPTKIAKIVIPNPVERTGHIYKDDYVTFKEAIKKEIKSESTI
ncbi:electron transfer flavoprotein subunit beta/FixA family protein [Schnuerera sp. xch1]|uniref:electron transfer flavoprotein subunit beta/FixA family protein n=1 Tax=Schnuerera sp. xch1 TaxID=2874283 RepID=UPI001CC120A0|nr:electron transfer flavoprotein subunit beta/FixA family protein [Schnuerera sp. xch1]MBZ2174534.1 electron transfer flavoprotein subunit beta/FixA family protein [Schnuerera sp. xch1]